MIFDWHLFLPPFNSSVICILCSSTLYFHTWFRLCYLVLYWHNFNLCFFLKVIYKIEKPFACIKWIFTSVYFLPVRNRIWEQILGTQSRGTIKLKRVYPIKHTSPQIQIWLTGKYVSKQERNTSTFVLRFWWELTLSWLTGRIEMPFLSRRASFVQIQRVLLLGRAGLCNFVEVPLKRARVEI